MEDQKRLERIEKKIDEVADHVASIDLTLAGQHISLRDHMRRTAILEKEVAPIKKYVYMAQGVIGLLGVLSMLLGLLKYLKYL
jgi:hypothetical protein